MNKRFPIRWVLFSHYILFSVFLLFAISLIQITFTDGFYRFHTKKQLTAQCAFLTENINHPELESLMVSLSREQSLSIYLVNKDYRVESRAEYSHPTSLIQSRSWFRDIWNLSDGEDLYFTTVESIQFYLDAYDHYEASHFSGTVPPKPMLKNLVCAHVVTMESGEPVLLILVSSIEPTTAIRQLIRNIVLLLSVFMLLFSFIFAWFSSYGFTRPIHNFSELVHRVSKGDYSVIFHSGSNREFFQLGKSLNHMVDQLSKTENLRRELIATVSHDLRTPLTMLRGYAEMMRDIPGENTPENAQIIIDEADRLSIFINNTLDLSRLRSGTQEMHPIVFCLTNCVRSLVESFLKLSNGQLNLSFSAEDPVYVCADEVYIARAVNNLINNAIVHGNSETVITVLQTINGNHVRVTIQDNGPGIPEDQINGIWEWYQKNSPSGTGLGLPIVKAAIEQNGGNCGVESALGKGSAFWIELPIAGETDRDLADY